MQVNIVCNKHLESALSKDALTEMFYFLMFLCQLVSLAFTCVASLKHIPQNSVLTVCK